MPEGKNIPKWELFHTIIFDFDGVFTDNKVFVDQNGIESIRCSRADGLGIDLLRKFILKNNWDLEFFILSTEKNPVVLKRAEKLKLNCHYAINNKLLFLQNYLEKRFPNQSSKNEGVIYLGNDLNDFHIMNYVGFSVAPLDAHPEILRCCDLILNSEGGNGFVREFIEKLISCNNVDYKELLKLI